MTTPLDPEYVQHRLSSLPFVVVDGIYNIRVLESYPSETVPGYSFKSNYVFRSGAISGVTLNGEEALNKLGIRKVFDLRSDIETKNPKFGRPSPNLRFGIEVERIPVLKDEDYTQESLTRRTILYKSENEDDLMIIYEDILLGSVQALGSILRHILTRPNDGFLFHCTAGKDRTGVVAAVLLKLAGVKDDLVAEDYALSRIGTEPKKEEIIGILVVLDDYKDDMPGLLRALDSRSGSMICFLSLLEKKYGGADGFVRNNLGFSQEELGEVKKNLLQCPAELATG